MSAPVGRARDPDAQARHEAALAALAAAFSQLPERRRLRCSHPVTGNSLTDTLVFAEAHDGSAWYEGVIVGGERDEAGAWMLDCEFTILTTDNDAEGELVLVHGYNCHVEIL